MESIFKLGILLRVTDMASGAIGKIGQSITTLGTKAEAMAPTFEKFKNIAAPLAAAGALMIAMLAGTVMSTVETQKALGELSSVGVKDMKALEMAGQDFSNKWSGTTKAQFIAAAYDIKGGIASLSDLGVAEFAKLAALTGKATKSTTQEMTSLFATGYGIYKDQYKNLSDMQFGQMFSGGIASAVNIFKSTGTGMAGAIENLGAAATVAKRPLEEQLTVLGMLQATMSGREAGTAYKAFFRDVGGAGKKLGLEFYDAAGNLKSITDIMGLLKGKFGDLSGKESNVLQKAFSDESYRMISQMYTKTGELGSNITTLFDAMKQGTVYTEQMASAMNQDIGAGMGVFRQRMHNLVEILGKQLIPILAPLFTVLGNGIMALQQFAEKHGTLTRVIMVSLAVIAVLLFVLGGIATVIGVIGLGAPAVAIGIGLISGAFATATAAAWAFTRALLVNPVTGTAVAITAAIVALGALFVWMYRRVEWFKTGVDAFLFFMGFSIGLIAKGWVNLAQWILLPFSIIWDVMKLLWNAIPRITAAISDAMAGLFNALPTIIGQAYNAIVNAAPQIISAIKAAFLGVLNAIAPIFKGLYTSGRMIIGTLVDGIKSVAAGPVDAIKDIFEKVRNLLPFSDAKEGPLSQLTLSGSRIMSTLGEGITGGAPGLHKTLANALAGAALVTTIGLTPAIASLPKSQPLAVAQPVAGLLKPQAVPAVNVPAPVIPAMPSMPALNVPAPIMPPLPVIQQVNLPALPGAAIPQQQVNPRRDNAAPQPAGKKIVIQIGKIELPGVSNGADFIKQLQALVEGHDVA